MRTAVVLLALSLFGCGGGALADFSPRNASKSYEPIVVTASRIPTIASINECGADEIGVVHASGRENEVIEAIAEEVADNGGTHYVIKGDETKRRLRHTWAIVYRLAKGEWECAGFHPHER